MLNNQCPYCSHRTFIRKNLRKHVSELHRNPGVSQPRSSSNSSGDYPLTPFEMNLQTPSNDGPETLLDTNWSSPDNTDSGFGGGSSGGGGASFSWDNGGGGSSGDGGYSGGSDSSSSDSSSSF